MNKEKYVFAQLIEFLDNNKFRRLVDKYEGNRYVKNFTCWNQPMALMFGQLSNRESLRDVVVALEAHHSKCYHLGMGKKPVAKTTFATANQNRDYRIFEEFAFFMMEQARKKRATDIFRLKGNVYAFDSTTIPLCLSVFWWAKFRKKKGGVKAHVLYDLEAQVPAFFHISTASVHDSKAMREIPYEPGAYYVFEQCREFAFLTNAFHITSLEVANLYKNRWQIELFFKWLKQHLKIKKFWGTTENAVRIQISAAIITYCLVAIVQHDMRLNRSTYEVLQILSISLTDKTPLRDLFEKTNFNDVKELDCSLFPGLFE